MPHEVSGRTLTLSLFRFDGNAGVLTYMHCESTLPDRSNSDGHSTSQLLAHPNRRHVYFGNRGTDSVAQFEFDEKRERLVRIGVHPTFGRPRAISSSTPAVRTSMLQIRTATV